MWDPRERQEAEASATLLMSPHRLKFCQNSIPDRFQNGTSVLSPRGLGLVRGIPKVLACFHEELDGTRLFALNNLTLFNAILNDVWEVLVTVVEKPSDWHRRFTGQWPWMCMQVGPPPEEEEEEEEEEAVHEGMALDGGMVGPCSGLLVGHIVLPSQPFIKIPAEAFPSSQTPSRCWLVLEARNLVNPKKNTLWDLLVNLCPDLKIQQFEGKRDYARVRVIEDDKPLVCSAIKALAKQLGKRPNDVDIMEVRSERRFDSPRD